MASTVSVSPTNADDQPDISLLSRYRLPVDLDTPHLILPVDPMGWHQSVIDWKTDTPLQDMILTCSKSGVLEFWTPQLGHHFAFEVQHGHAANGTKDRQNGNLHDHDESPWTRSGVVRTGRADALMARCSSRKKTVLGKAFGLFGRGTLTLAVCETPDGGHEMSIWDSNVSEFSTGMELVYTFRYGTVDLSAPLTLFSKGNPIQDLDWTTTSDLQSVLAVGFAHKVVLVCEQRMNYVESTPGWAPFLTIDLERYGSVLLTAICG